MSPDSKENKARLEYEHFLVSTRDKVYFPMCAMHVGPSMAVYPLEHIVHITPIGIAYRIAEVVLQNPHEVLSSIDPVPHKEKITDPNNLSYSYETMCNSVEFTLNGVKEISSHHYSRALHRVFGLDRDFWHEVEDIRDKYEHTHDCVACFDETIDLLRKHVVRPKTQSLKDVTLDQL